MNDKNLSELLKRSIKENKEKFSEENRFSSPLLSSNNSSPTKEEKLNKLEDHFREILKILNLDLSHPSIKDTPKRMAKMYLNEIFSGLDEKNFPKLCFFPDSTMEEKKIILIKEITINSICEHHFLPLIGKAYVSYIPNHKIIGLSKINRLVDYLSRRPQLQERLTEEISSCISQVLETPDVAVYTSIKHLCVTMRGANDYSSQTTAYIVKGRFKTDLSIRQDFLSQIVP
jgi:GTP cyclohydrolase IA